jgi:hypothetical protein
MRVLFALGVFVLATGVAVMPPAFGVTPVNDSYANAEVIAGESGSTGPADISSASIEIGEPWSFGEVRGRTVWYAWTAPSSGTYAFETSLSEGVDTTISVFTRLVPEDASLAGLAPLMIGDQLVANDDVKGLVATSGVVFPAQMNQTYYLQVGNHLSPAGLTTLTWSKAAGADLGVAVGAPIQIVDSVLFSIVIYNDSDLATAPADFSVDFGTSPGIEMSQVHPVGALVDNCPGNDTAPFMCALPVLEPGETIELVVAGGATVTGVYEITVNLPGDAVAFNNTQTNHRDYVALMPLSLQMQVERAPGTQVWLHYGFDRHDGWDQRTSIVTLTPPANARIDDALGDAASDICTVGNQVVCDFTGLSGATFSLLVTPRNDQPMVSTFMLSAQYVQDVSDTVSRGPSAFCDNVPTAGNDTVDGNGQDNILCGGAGNDIFKGGRGNDLIFGGAGVDTVSYFDAVAGMEINLGHQAIDGYGSRPLTWRYADGFDSFIGIENARGSEFPDVLYGNNQPNTLWGGDFEDALYGRGGSDRLFGEREGDRLYGGVGKDYLNGAEGTDYCRDLTDKRVYCER